MAAAAGWRSGPGSGLLWIHAAGKVSDPGADAHHGRPAMEHYVGVWTRGVLGTLALVSGLVLVASLPRYRRRGGAVWCSSVSGTS